MSATNKRRRKAPATWPEDRPTQNQVPLAVPVVPAPEAVQQMVAAVTPAVTAGVVKTLMDLGVISTASGAVDQQPETLDNQASPNFMTGSHPPQPPSHTTPPPSHAPTYNTGSLAPVPLGLGLDPKIKAKIWAHEFVDFGFLLPNNNASGVRMVEGVDGGFVLHKTSTPPTITTLDTWFEAFFIYASIFISRQPEQAVKIFKYASIVQDLSRQAGDSAALFYDIQFRKLREAMPDMLSFDMTHTETHTRALGMGLYPQNKQVSVPQGQKKRGGRQSCDAYNRAFCTRGNCKYPHICKICGGKHTQKQCPKHSPKATTSVASNKPKPGARQ